MARGGKREHSGRKASPVKTLKLGSSSSERLLLKLKHEEETLRIYKGCKDYRLQWQILEDLRDRAFGKATQPIDHGVTGMVSVHIDTNVNMPDPHE